MRMAYRCHRSKANMASGGKNFDRLKEKMKELRQGKKGKKDAGKSAKELDTIIVQRLSVEVFRLSPEVLSCWSARVCVLRRLRRNIHQQHQESVHEVLRYVGNHVVRCARRGAVTLLFLSKTVTKLESNPRAIH